MQTFFARHKIKPQKVAVAVSGGADSLALALMAKDELAVFGYEVTALTVDHKLRPTSTQEAAYVAEIMKTHGIEHHILEWTSEKPKNGVEETARIARYQLLTEWCQNHGIRILLTAHHLNDQAETFLMRLQRGSGLDGLCCMREISDNNGVMIARPLLKTAPEALRQYLQHKNIKWIEDESNGNTDYLRNRIRAFMPQIEKEIGITPRELAQTAFRLQSAEEYIEQQLNHIFETQIQAVATNIYCFHHTDFLTWHREIKFRILAELCRRNYIPRAEHILNAIAAMNKLPFTGLTLGGKEIFSAYGNIWIVPELCAKRKPSRDLWKNFTLKNPQYAKQKIPHKARVAILQHYGEKL